MARFVSRSWNIHISHRDLRAHRRDAELAAGAETTAIIGVGAALFASLG